MTSSRAASGDSGEQAADPARRAACLLRWYPRAWRDRYGPEFAELLIADITERPRAPLRTLDVARGGIVARLASLGLCGVPVTAPGQEPAQPARASLATTGACLAAFMIVAAALWSQLAIGWQWSAPGETATVAGMVLMSAAMLALAALCALAVLRYAWAVATRLARGQARGLIIPALVLAASLTALFLGGRHFGNGWPGTGGHPWATGAVRFGGHEWIGRGLVPGGFAAFSWASTLSVSTYWLHPSALAAFPAAEVAWMAASPLALGGAAWAAAALARRTSLPPRALAFQARLAPLACLAMLAFFAGCGCWVASGGQGLFRAGTIDAAGVAVLAATLAVAGQASRHARRAMRG